MIARDVKSKATMRINGEYVAEIPPHRFTRTRTGKEILWLPGETLPRYAKHMRDTVKMDVAVGDVAYYEYRTDGYGKRNRGRKYYKWWIGEGHDELDLSTMTMGVKCNA